MKRKIIFIITGLLLMGLFWFLLIKKYDYQINFLIKTSPGTVYSYVLGLESWDIKKPAKEISIINKEIFSSIDQEINLKDAVYKYNWNFKAINDSISKVTVNVLDTKHSLKQRLLFLIGKSGFVKISIQKISDIKEALEQHLEKISVEVIGKSEIPAYESIIYVTFNSDLPGKARNMTTNLFYLMQYMELHNIKKTGDPFMNITKWNVQTNIMQTEFCFPVEKLAHYPLDSVVKVKQNISARPALKAVFHGNYRFSDRAWFALLNYAERHQIDVEKAPFEIYYNDPHNYSNELEWKADVYLPLK